MLLIDNGWKSLVCDVSIQTGLGVLPDERNINVPVMVWRSCAYTVMAVGSLQHFILYSAFFCNLKITRY